METVLKTKDIIKKYGTNTVLNGISMTINKGDIYGFIGKNGAGKTTFMRVVLSLTTKNSGEVVFFDHQNIEQVGLKVGSLIESPGLYKNSSAYENLKRFSILYGADENKILELLDIVGLNNVGKRKVKNFSLGMKQRLGIAIALLGEPELLLLDEPINGLDPEGIKEIRDIIVKLNKEKKITILISSHLLDELSKVVTRYGIINKGELIEEIESKELKNKCRNKLIIECDNPKKAQTILADIVPNDDIFISGKTLEIHSNIEKAAEMNTKLVKENISVSSIYTSFDSLEDYFMRKIGD